MELTKQEAKELFKKELNEAKLSKNEFVTEFKIKKATVDAWLNKSVTQKVPDYAFVLLKLYKENQQYLNLLKLKGLL